MSLLSASSTEQRIVRQASLLLLAGVGLAWLLFLTVGPPLLRAVFAGDALPYLAPRLQRFLQQNPTEASPEAFLARIQAFALRVTLVYALFQAILLMASQRHPQLFTAFLGARQGPFTLALFRLLFFGTLLAKGDLGQLLHLSQLDPGLRVAPPGLSWLMPLLPTSPTLITGLWLLFKGTCLAALLGWHTRTAAALATVLAFYVLGVPQFFGKINHYHHLIWFSAVLAASPCADVLSVDALRQARRRAAATAELNSPEAAVAYALPLRLIWLLLSLLYFFPGFWKFTVSGTAWFWSDNLKYTMYNKWIALDGWTPFVAIDQYPLLYKLGGLATVAFELGFVLLIFSLAGRRVAALSGLLFHGFVRLFLRISFWPLPLYYLAFFDLQRLLARLGRHLYRHPLSLTYAPTDPAARYLVASAQTMDLFQQVTYHPQPDLAHGVATDDATGPPARLRLMRYVPLIGLIWPVLHRWPLPMASVLRPHSWRPTALVGGVLLILNLACGFTLLDSWPVGVYPTFAALARPELPSVAIRWETTREASPQEVEVLLDPIFRQRFSDARLRGMIQAALHAPASERQDRLIRLWQVWAAETPGADHATTVTFYQTTLATDPAALHLNPRHRSLLFTYSPPRPPAP